MATLKAVEEGFVNKRVDHLPRPAAAGPRLARLADGHVYCSFVVQSALGINDFVPKLAVSEDEGRTWSQPRTIFPMLREQYSIFGAISAAPDGSALYFYGTRYVIDKPGESFWQEANQGLKQNELFWSRSLDGGATWTDPRVIPMPIPGSAEAPGAMCVTRSGSMHVCYAPYNTFDMDLIVPRDRIICLSSDDGGTTWRCSDMLRFTEPDSGGAEAWVVELTDGRLLGTSWHFNVKTGSDFPDAFAISEDNGKTWHPTQSTGIKGQSTGLAPLPDGRALFVYNQRRVEPFGVGMAIVKPAATEFGVQCNELVWRAADKPLDATHSQWQSFAFGEPAVLPLSEREALLVLWCIQPDGKGIRYVRVRMD